MSLICVGIKIHFHINGFALFAYLLKKGLEQLGIGPFLVTSPESGCKKHLQIEGTRNCYFQTIGYCSITKVKRSLILRRFYATWP